MLERALYIPDLALCDFSFLKGTDFESVENKHKKMAEVFQAHSQNNFIRCYKSWKGCVGQYVASDGNYFQGDNR
jgi:hypothetical protein